MFQPKKLRENTAPTEALEYQDVVNAYLMGGTAKVGLLYAGDWAEQLAGPLITHEIALRALETLSEAGQDTQALAVCLASFHRLPLCMADILNTPNYKIEIV